MQINHTNIDLKTLIGYGEWVEADSKLDEVHRSPSNHDFDFVAALDNGQLIGVCSRADIGMLLGHRIKCLHIADNFGWQDDHLPPGDGIVDLPGIVKKLRGAGYNGVWCLEIATESTGRNWAINDFVHHSKDNLLRIIRVTEGE